MSLSGPNALRAIEEALRDIRREEDDTVRRMARSTELLAKLRAQEGELFRQLGALRLDATARSALAAELSEMEGGVADMLERHARRLAGAEAELAEIDAALLRAATDRAGLRAEAAQREAELESLASKARPKLGTDPAYAAKLKAARELADLAEQAAEKTAQAEADRERKDRPFRQDPLFSYLWERGFGTKAYRCNAITGWFDGLVARTIGFGEARGHFLMQNELPLRLREHAERLQQRAREAAAEIAAIESVAVDAAGGKAAREAVAALNGRIAEIDTQVVALQDRRDEALKLQRDLAQGADPEFSGALDGLSRLLGRHDLWVLLSEARATPKGQDIAVVQQIDDLRERARGEGEEAREQRAQLKLLAARRRDLEDIQYEMKGQGFDSPRARFGEDSLADDLLNAFLRGESTAAAYWDRWRQALSWTGETGGRLGGRGGSGLNRPRGAARPMTSAA